MEEEILRIQDRIQIALETGESHFREFKSAFQADNEGSKRPRPTKEICKDVAETLVGFVNADGGELIIGIENDSTITGIPHKEEDIKTIINSTKTHIHNTTPLSEAKHFKVNFNQIIPRSSASGLLFSLFCHSRLSGIIPEHRLYTTIQ